MLKFDILDYGVYADDKHIADFDNLGMAIQFAREFTTNNRGDTYVVSNLTGEIQFTANLVEVTAYKVEEWIAE